MSETMVTATFRSQAEAQRASEALGRLGISPDNIRLVEDAPNPASVVVPEETGWDALRDSQPRNEDALQRLKGIPRGAYVVGADVDSHLEDAVTKLLSSLGGSDVRSSTRR